MSTPASTPATIAVISTDPHMEAVARIRARLAAVYPAGWAAAPVQVRHCSSEDSAVHRLASPEIRNSPYFLSPQAFARDRVAAAIVPEVSSMNAGDALRSIAFLASDPEIRAVGVRRMRKNEGWTRQLIWSAECVPAAVASILSGPVEALATECCGGELYRTLAALRRADPTTPAIDVLRTVDRAPGVRAAAAACVQPAPATPTPEVTPTMDAPTPEATPVEVTPEAPTPEADKPTMEAEPTDKPAKRMPRRNGRK